MGTYLVMLMQFKMSLNRSQQRAAMRNHTMAHNLTMHMNGTTL